MDILCKDYKLPQFTQKYSFLYHFQQQQKKVSYSCDGKADFVAVITPVFTVT